MKRMLRLTSSTLKFVLRKDHDDTMESKSYQLSDKQGKGVFLEVSDNSGSWSGGNQKWFDGTADARGVSRSDFGSCAVMAATNVLAYMDKKELFGISKGVIIPLSSYKKNGAVLRAEYMKLASKIYDDYLTPFDINKLFLIRLLKLKLRLSLGVLSYSRLKKGILSFAADRGIFLTEEVVSNNDLGNPDSLARACRFIKKALMADRPVVIFITRNKSACQPGSTDWHYMIITRIEEQYEDEKLVGAKIAVSTWGIESVIDFKKIWYDSVFYRAECLLNKCVFTRLPGKWIGRNIRNTYLITFTQKSGNSETDGKFI